MARGAILGPFLCAIAFCDYRYRPWPLTSADDAQAKMRRHLQLIHAAVFASALAELASPIVRAETPADQRSAPAGSIKDTTVRLRNGSIYQGTAIKGVPEGRGAMVAPDGDEYSGEFHNGELNGPGYYQWNDGSSYAGSFADGSPNGKGTFIFTNGTKYSGEVHDGQPNGTGTFFYLNGTRYDGQVRNGAPDGRGTLTRADGTQRNSNWVMGKPVD
jgi:hypothetical protein